MGFSRGKPNATREWFLSSTSRWRSAARCSPITLKLKSKRQHARRHTSRVRGGAVDERIRRVRAIIAEASRPPQALVVQLYPPERKKKILLAARGLLAVIASFLFTTDTGRARLTPSSFSPNIADTTPWKCSPVCDPYAAFLYATRITPPSARPVTPPVERWL